MFVWPHIHPMQTYNQLSLIVTHYCLINPISLSLFLRDQNEEIKRDRERGRSQERHNSTSKSTKTQANSWHQKMPSQYLNPPQPLFKQTARSISTGWGAASHPSLSRSSPSPPPPPNGLSGDPNRCLTLKISPLVLLASGGLGVLVGCSLRKLSFRATWRWMERERGRQCSVQTALVMLLCICITRFDLS